MGAGVGAALFGQRPIVEISFGEFLPCAMNQLMLQAPNIHYMTAGQATVPLVLRTGAWLTSNESGLDGAAWEGAFAAYRKNLRGLKALGEELRPTTLRDGEELLAGRELAAEAAELFAA